jgi:hypothetical protein
MCLPKTLNGTSLPGKTIFCGSGIWKYSQIRYDEQAWRSQKQRTQRAADPSVAREAHPQ